MGIFSKVAVGDKVCLLLGEGEVYGFGYNSCEQIGLKNRGKVRNSWSLTKLLTDESVYLPVKTICDIEGFRVADISCGGEHSLLLTEDGKAYGVGENKYAQLGYVNAENVTENSATPLWIMGDDDSKIVAVSAGFIHSLFLTDDGRVYICDGEKYLDAKDGDKTGFSSNTTLIDDIPVKVKAIGAGTAFSLFLGEDGKVYSMGKNYTGQCGYKHYNMDGEVQKVELPDDVEIVAISAGATHSLFLAKDGGVYSCGSNAYGQTLSKETKCCAKVNCIPTKVIEDIKGEKVVSVAAGGYHSLFLTESGKVYGCGMNEYGVLGVSTGMFDQSVHNELLETDLSNIDGKVVSVATRAANTLFLTDKGDVYSCGSDINHQLGLYSKKDVFPAEPVPQKITVAYTADGLDKFFL